MKSNLFNLGFRIFFASAAIFAVVVMLWWLAMYDFALIPTHLSLPIVYWHGHEMVFGYGMAVVAGFLLTAVQNWTGQAMPYGRNLFFIWLPWFIARVLFALGVLLNLALFCDLVFSTVLVYVIAKAVIAVRQWRQMGILSKLVLLVLANLLFWIGYLQWLSSGEHMGLYLGVFVILALLLTIGRRVTPFFIERGVGVSLRNSALVDRMCLVSFFAFFLLEVFTPWQQAASYCALLSALTNGWRLLGWYTVKLWHKPLLWSMYLSLWFMVLGFLLFFLRVWLPVTVSLALHMMTVGGIGVMTFSMMGRVSLGHTGRNIHMPPKRLIIGFYLLFAALFFRVLMPLFFPATYLVWMVHAQVLWIMAFLLLVSAYLPIWLSPRPDGRMG